MLTERDPKIKTPYWMCITNVARFIHSPENRIRNDEYTLDVFTAAATLSIAFCKIQEDVIADLITCKV